LLYHRDKNVLVVATKQDTAKNLIRSIKTIFKSLPSWMINIAKIKVDNRNSIELENGSRVKAITTSADAGRSEAVSLLVVDEAAFIQTFAEVWTGISPTISTRWINNYNVFTKWNSETPFIICMKEQETMKMDLIVGLELILILMIQTKLLMINCHGGQIQNTILTGFYKKQEIRVFAK
jgi:hypothetical protein